MGSITKPSRTMLLTLVLLNMLFSFGILPVSHAARPAHFSLDANPASISIKAGTLATSTITITSRGFTGPVSLTAAVSPDGPTATVDPASVILVSGGTAKSNLTITTSNHIPLGNYTVTVTGTGVGWKSRVTVNVIVTTASDFTLDATPNALSTQLGRTVHTNVTVQTANFQGSISLQVDLSPNGPSAIFTPGAIYLEGNATATSDLSITATCSSVPGEYSVVVTGQWGPLSRSVGVTLTILDLLDPIYCPPDFTLTPDRQDLTVTAGQTGAFFVTLRGVNNFTGNVTLDATVDPSGPQTLLARTSVALETVTVASVEVMIQATSAYLGTFSVTVIAVSGDTTHSASIQATIVPAAENPPPQTSPPPGGGTEANYPVALIVLVAVNVALAGATLWAVVSLIRNRRQQLPAR